jgi:hypothetical protein
MLLTVDNDHRTVSSHFCWGTHYLYVFLWYENFRLAEILDRFLQISVKKKGNSERSIFELCDFKLF